MPYKLFWGFLGLFQKKIPKLQKGCNFLKFWSSSNIPEKLFFWKQTAFPKPYLAQNATYWLSDDVRHPNMAFSENIIENYHFCGILLVILDNFWDYWPSRLIFWSEFDITSAMINIFSKFKKPKSSVVKVLSI